MGMKKESKLQEAYDCGFEDGYEKAMEDLEDKKKKEHSYRSEESGYRRMR